MWDVIPSKIIGKYQASRENPEQVYLELKRKTVDDPEKISHDTVVDLLQRYRQALPDNEMGMQQVKQYYADRIEEVRQMATKADYDRAKLLLMVSTCLSHSDQVQADNYLTLHKSSPAMTEYANRKIHNKIDQMYKSSNLGKKPEDSILANPSGKIGRALHQLAVQGKTLPKAWTRPPPPAGGKFNRKNGRPNGQSSPYKRKQNNFNGQNRQQNHQSNSTRARGGNRGGYKNQGGRALQFNKQSNDQSKRESIAEIVPKYDVTKIPAKLKHFASEETNTANLKQLLVDQCDTENLSIELD